MKPAKIKPPTLGFALSILALDAVLIVVFAMIGRASHGESALNGLFTTAWPFLAALGVGWVVSLAWRNPAAPVRTGIPVWAVTVAGGMLLRAVSGQGTALPFIIVATLTLAAFLIVSRVIITLIRRAKR